MRRVRCLAAAALLAAPPAFAARRDRVPAARPSGEPVTCVPIVQIRETRVRSDSVIDFVMRGNKVYRNTLPNRCPQLGFEEAFSYATSLSQLCNVDIITVIRRAGGGGGGFTGASCGLGTFQPVTLVHKERK